MSTIIEMPKLSDTMSVGTVVKWYKNIGETVVNGDILAEIETDKATMELEVFDDGVLLQLLASEGDEVEIGRPLAIIGEEGEEVPPLDDAVDRKAEHDNVAIVHGEEAKAIKEATPDQLSSSGSGTTDSDSSISANDQSRRLLASPLAKKIAAEKGFDLSKIRGSGPGGRITKKDLPSDGKSVLDEADLGTKHYDDLSLRTADNLSTLQYKSIPVSKMRSVIAKRLLESKTTIPHFYLQKEINSEPLRIARESINQRLANQSSVATKVSINDLILLSCTRAIPQVPEINTSWADKEIIFHANVNLAFGVAIDEGLVTPVIRNAEQLDLRALSSEARSLIEKSRSRKLTADEMTGSTFTVTNLGMFGIDFFSGIINPPNAAILAVGSSVKKPVLAKDGSIRSGETMTLGLSCDHRLVDGAIGARFLQVLAELIENPASMLI